MLVTSGNFEVLEIPHIPCSQELALNILGIHQNKVSATETAHSRAD